jgi:hypothetical protein
LSLPVPATIPPFQQASPGTQDVTVDPHQSITLTAGAYRDILVKHHGTILFSGGGSFALRSLDTGDEVTLEFDAPTTIMISDKLDTDHGCTVGPQAGASIDATDIVFHVAGINGSTGNLGASPKAVQIGSTNTLQASLHAPNGTVWLRQGTVASGTFIGRDVMVGEQVEVGLPGGGALALARPSAPVELDADPFHSNVEAPEVMALHQNHPNPFNRGTTIAFSLPEAGDVGVSIYSITGQLVRALGGRLAPGRHQIAWDGRAESGQPVPPGVYLYRLSLAGESGTHRSTATRRMTLLR